MVGITAVGCGLMGSALVNALMIGGNTVAIVDLTEKNAEQFVERGASYFPEISKAPDNNFILFNLPNHKIAKGVAESFSDNWKGKILVNTTTSSILEIKDMQQYITSKGGRYLGAAIECYPAEIGADSGYIVYAGDKSVFDETEKVLKSMGAAEFLGDNVISTAIADMTVGIHYGLYPSLLEGAAICLKNDFPVSWYLERVDASLANMVTAAKRQILHDLENYNGTFADSDEASLEVETAGAWAVVKGLEESNARAVFTEFTANKMQKMIDEGYGKKSMAVLIKEILEG